MTTMVQGILLIILSDPYVARPLSQLLNSHGQDYWAVRLSNRLKNLSLELLFVEKLDSYHHAQSDIAFCKGFSDYVIAYFHY